MQSWRSPKTEIKTSPIEGKGILAVAPIAKDEVIGVKGGHILDWHTYEQHKEVIGASYLSITDELMIAPLTKNEVDGSMMYLNHSCDPNVGVLGNIVFIAMRPIEAGEELVTDYAMIDGEEDEYRMDCHCGTPTCRKVITPRDWQNPELQRKYAGYFSAYIQRKIDEKAS